MLKKVLSGLAAVVILTATNVDAEDFSLFDSALAQVAMTHEDVRIDQDELATWGGDLWRTRYFTMFHKNPFKLPKYGRLNLDALKSNVNSPTALLSISGKMIDHPIRRGLIGDQLSQYVDIPDSLPRPSITRSKGVLGGEEYAELKNRIDLLYQVVEDDGHFLTRSFKDFDDDKYRKQLFEFFVQNNEEYEDLTEELAEAVDFDRLIAGAQDIAEVSIRLADSLAFLTFPSQVTEFQTRKGLIVVGTTGNDRYEYFEPPLLIVDGGGDDEYLFGGYPDGSPVAVIVDVAGNDRYVSTDSTKPGIGGAVLGVSVLLDQAGDDYYEGVHVTQGSGLFGVGLLLDHSGNDVYAGNSYCQGSGVFGIGIAADSAGHDSLYCIITSQGFGYTRGCGLLINFEGNDKYVAENDTLLNPSSQSPEHNNSLVQGVGFGKRADFIDGHSWAGGVGILADGSGDDHYSAGLFAQGCAYWYAVGMLLDGDGADVYDGIWYVQGSGAHFGVGYLDDFAGDDRYNANTDPKNMAVGAGHDFTVGFFNERSGNDTYNVPNLSLGGGNVNGIGIFWDHEGDDRYKTKAGTTLGRANGSQSGTRSLLYTFGVFVDGGGEDSYDVEYAGNGSRWVGPKSRTEDPSPFEIGVGIDQ